MRRPHKKVERVVPDLRYDSMKLSKFVNYIMLDGKKSVALKIVYGALDIIKENTSVKARSSYKESVLKKEKLKIEKILKNLGYYNSDLDISIEESNNNLVNIIYNIDLGKKSKIKRIQNH